MNNSQNQTETSCLPNRRCFFQVILVVMSTQQYHHKPNMSFGHYPWVEHLPTMEVIYAPKQTVKSLGGVE